MIVGHLASECLCGLPAKLSAIYEAKGIASPDEKKALPRSDKEAAFYSGRIASAKFFTNDILTTVKARCEAIKMNEKAPLEIAEEAFAW